MVSREEQTSSSRLNGRLCIVRFIERKGRIVLVV